YAPIDGDPLEGRRRLKEQARALLHGQSPGVIHTGGVWVEGFEFNSATHRYRVMLRGADQNHVEEVDQVIVNNGFGTDNSIYRELRLHECYEPRGPMKLAAALQAAGGAAADCLDVPAAGAEALRNPEPGFFILGNKSYGRAGNFLLETGYRQVADAL